MAEQKWLNADKALILFAMGLSITIIANDFSSMNVALPAIEKSYDSNLTTVQWVINAFGIAFAVLVITGGRFADMYGRRRSYIIGGLIFGVFSFLGTFSPDVYTLITARFIMGIGSALLFPAVVGIIYQTFPEELSGLAGGMVAGCVGLGQVLGPLIGGSLTTYASWRWVLFINLPVILIAMLITLRAVKPERPVGEGEIDYIGSAILSGGLLLLLLGLTQSSTWGWSDPLTIIMLVVSIVLLIVFILFERRIGSRALLPEQVMKNREFVLNCVAVAFLAMTFFVTLLYLPQFTQRFLSYSALEAGVALLPMAVTFSVVSFISGRIYDHTGPKLVMSCGAALTTIGAAWFAFIPDEPTYLWLVPGMLIMGVGVGLFFSAATTAGVTALDPSESSLGGGVIFMARVAGGSIGIALTTALFTTVTRNEIEDKLNGLGVSLGQDQINKLDGLLVGSDSSTAILSLLPAEILDRLRSIAEAAFITGFQSGMLLNTVLGLIGFLVVLFFVGGSFKLSTLSDAEREAKARVARHLHHTPGG